MSKLVKKENMVISIGTYTGSDGQEKKQYKTVGELVTMENDRGSFQFFQTWGPTGVQKGNIYAQEERNYKQERPKPNITRHDARDDVDFEEDIPF